MSSIIVQKFGGSSVADVERIGHVADKIVATAREGHQVVAVVSAMGKTTDSLLSLARQIDAAPPRRELDMLLTTGERVSIALLSMAIQKRGARAMSFTGSQSGIITTDNHFDARIIEVRPHRIIEALQSGHIVIVAGYQGMSLNREITTLGRGGTDTTALALAAALKAERAEIYSDVDGVYSADPRLVPDAQHLPSISYEQMQALSDAGAKVLQAEAVAFAAQHNIALHARSTFDAQRETIVSVATTTRTPSVVIETDIAKLSVPNHVAPSLLAGLRTFGAVVRACIHTGGQLTAFVNTRLTPQWARILSTFDSAAFEMGCVISVIAARSGEETYLLEELYAVVPLTTEKPSWTAPLRVSFFETDIEHAQALVQTLHKSFVQRER